PRGAELTDQVRVENDGPSNVNDVELRVSIPFRMRLEGVTSDSGSCTVQQRSATCALGTLSAFHPVEIRVALQARLRGPAVVRARASGTDATEFFPSNNRLLLRTQVGHLCFPHTRHSVC